VSDAFAPRNATFPPIPVDDCVLVLTHLQNDFWHRNGAFYALTESTLPYTDTLQRILNVAQACRGADIPLIFHNESWRPGHPEIRQRRRGYALGSAKSLGAQEGNIAVRGSWGADILEQLRPIAGRDEYVIENSKVDPFTCSEFEVLLRNLNRNVLILVGLAVNFGIEMTVRTASEKDYGACVLSDCTDRLFGAYTEATINVLLPHYARVMTSGTFLQELDAGRKHRQR
jgi:nicotinamidase-related amidase